MATISNFSTKRPLMEQLRDSNVDAYLPFEGENFKCSNEVNCNCKNKRDRSNMSITVDKSLKKAVKEVLNGNNN